MLNRLFGNKKASTNKDQDNKSKQPKQKQDLNKNRQSSISINQKRWNSNSNTNRDSMSLQKSMKNNVGKIAHKNPFVEVKKVQDESQNIQGQLSNLLKKVYQLDTQITNTTDFKPKWTAFKEALGQNFKTLGFQIKPLTKVGNEALKCGRFVTKYCQLVCRNKYASSSITNRAYYNKYKDVITYNREYFDKFFKVFLQKQAQKQQKRQASIQKQKGESLKRVQIVPEKKRQDVFYPDLDQYVSIKQTYIPVKPNLKKQKEDQQKRNSASKKKELVNKQQQKSRNQTPAKSPIKKKSLNSYRNQYILDYFEINQIYSLNEVQIEGLLDTFGSTYAIFYCKIKKTKKQQTMIGIIKQKDSYDQDRRILKKIEAQYQNLCFLQLEGKSVEQILPNY